MSPVWTHTNPLPDGHTLFFTDTHDYPTLIAIADESGDKPEDTDDGILWLDFDRPLMAGTHKDDPDDPNSRLSSYCSIPLKTPDSEETRTISDIPTLFLLAAWFNWPVNIRGILHRIQKDNSTEKLVPLSVVLEELDAAGELEAATLIGAHFS
jgi:hypothetical protein